MEDGTIKEIEIKSRAIGSSKHRIERFKKYVRNKALYGTQYTYKVEEILRKRETEEAKKKPPKWIQQLVGSEMEEVDNTLPVV